MAARGTEMSDTIPTDDFLLWFSKVYLRRFPQLATDAQYEHLAAKLKEALELYVIEQSLTKESK